MTNRTELTSSEVKEYIYDILKYFHEICVREDIEYSLCYGTLLGAVRHQGFIPWDDDIDVCLKRSEYEKLIKILENEENSRYKVLHLYNNDSYFYNFAKLVDCNTSIIEEKYNPIDGYGLYIDIFPLDTCPGEEKKFNKYVKKINMLSAFKSVSVTKNFKKDIMTTSGILKLILFPFAKIPGRKFWCKKIEKQLMKYRNSNTGYMCCMTEHPKYSEIMSCAELDETSEILFENGYFKSFKDSVLYLKRRYGDYMKLPPESSRIPTHNYIAYSITGE